MGGLACLPDPGGINSQSCWLMDAFQIIEAANYELRKREGAEGGEK